MSMTSTTRGVTDRVKVFTFIEDHIAEARDMKPGGRGVEVVLPGTDQLTGRIKVYVSGGENVMHSHPREDHVFYILGGKAEFHIERDDNEVTVGVNEAVLLPRGTRYWFKSCGETNLVILRVGSGKDASYRLDAAGNEMESGSASWPEVEATPLT